MNALNEGSRRVLVMKFGGTSVGNYQAISQVVDIVRDTRKDFPELVVVTSAMAGVTNLLLDSAQKAAVGQIEASFEAAEQLSRMHHSVIDQLDLGNEERIREEIDELVGAFLQMCQAVSVVGEATPRALDAISGFGERMSVRLLSSALTSGGIDACYVEATELIVTDSRYQAAFPDIDATTQRTRSRIIPILEERCVPVITGFIAANKEGVTTTLGRGGSDYSAAIIGAVLPAEQVWIWTDVDGVMTADPRLVPQARSIPQLSYREIAELAYYGAKVVHPKTIRPVIEAGIGLRVANTFNPRHPGTWLVPEAEVKVNGAIKAVTAIRGQSLITIEGRGMLGVPGVAARAFGAVAATGTSVPLITQASSEQSICFAVPVESVQGVSAALESAFAIELVRRDIDRIWASDEVVIITVVGAGMQHTPGIAGKIFGRLGEQGVNVIAIAQGSSEVSISLVVDAADAEKAVRALHELIVPNVAGG